MDIKFRDKEYGFLYYEGEDGWICQKPIELGKVKLHFEIHLKNFQNKDLNWELIPEFLLFLEENLYNELDNTAQKILMPFNKIIDHEYLNQLDKFRFELFSIEYKEPGRSFNPLYNKIGFNYSLCYQLFHSDYVECYAPYTFYFVDFLNTTLIGCRVDLPY